MNEDLKKIQNIPCSPPLESPILSNHKRHFSVQGILTSIKGEVRMWPGKPYPLGATWDGAGVNFALFSENATKVELCFFSISKGKTEETHRLTLREYTDYVFHCYIPDARPGQLYGYRVHGPWDPQHGNRFNPNKVMIDPYAKAIGKTMIWDNSMFPYDINNPSNDKDLIIDEKDNIEYCSLAAVVDTAFTWGNDFPPNIPWHKTVIYETHIRELTMKHPDIPEHLRGTYTAVCFEPIIKHLKHLGVTAVEFMPVHHRVDDKNLLEKGLSNHWGYNTLSYFAPDVRYTSSDNPAGSVQEFKTMVRTLHSHGIEVILDVVYNHTAEGNHFGPIFNFKGIDNKSYYRLVENNERYYFDYTGCGNTLNVRHPRVLQLIMDSLRYWIQEMHVDGFRFDLASTLARTFYEVDKLGAFFDIIHQDPVISRVKLIAEPWDLGEGGYQVGNFPVLWTEWNGRYRDAVRAFWNGKGCTLSELATRLTGSDDLYSHTNGRSPHASINFVTCHDGFSLYDLVSYNEKHNEANLEDNKDGSNNNLSWNCGFEGLTKDKDIESFRWRQRANIITTLFVSLGVPMISGGDELSHTKKGNNNSYCQDNDITWYDWAMDSEDGFKQTFLEFVQKLSEIRKNQPVLLRRKHFEGKIMEGGLRDITWLHPDGREPNEQEWKDPSNQAIGYILEGTLIDEMSDDGKRIVGDTLLILINAFFHKIEFKIPFHRTAKPWTLILTTSPSMMSQIGHIWQGSELYPMEDHTISIFQLFKPKKFTF